MYRIYFPASWGESSEKIKNTFSRLLAEDEREVEVVSSVDDAEYVIIQDSADEPIPENKKVIFFQKEPEHVLRHNYEGSNLFCKWCHSDGDGWMPQAWWLNYSHKELTELQVPQKTYRLSIVDSGRAELPGHIQRLHALQDIVNHVPDVHAWGRIASGREDTEIFKSSLPYRSKEKAYLDYRYSMSIENGQTPFYFSEKIIDPMLCWTTPIYWGCSNIDRYFPKGSYIQIKELKKGVGAEVASIIESDFHEQNRDALAEARDLILNKYNLISTIKKILQ